MSINHEDFIGPAFSVLELFSQVRSVRKALESPWIHLGISRYSGNSGA
jgi:hypothetical protein